MSTEKKLPTTINCNCCGAIIAQNFTSEKLPLLYCPVCAAAIIEFKNFFSKKEIYRKNILSEYQTKLNAENRVGFECVMTIKYNFNYYINRLLNKFKETA